jgi:hypothetical protein
MTLPCRWRDGGLAGFAGRVRFRRRFGYPGRIDDYERVWLTFAGIEGRAEVSLNGQALGVYEGTGEPPEFEVTRLLGARNELVIEVESASDAGGLWGEVALEVRRAAYLRAVRVAAGQGGELRVSGEVVGSAERPLDLYVLGDRATVAYATVIPAEQGQAFELTAKIPQTAPAVRVELVDGGSVWYAVEREVNIP